MEAVSPPKQSASHRRLKERLKELAADTIVQSARYTCIVVPALCLALATILAMRLTNIAVEILFPAGDAFAKSLVFSAHLMSNLTLVLVPGCDVVRDTLLRHLFGRRHRKNGGANSENLSE